MNPLRKILGFFIAVIVGVPILFGTIVAIGITNAAISPEFLSEMPEELIEKLPATLDQLYTETKSEDFIDGKEYSYWLDAMKKVDRSPSEIIEKSGMMDWIKGELTSDLKQLGEVLRGDLPPENIIMDMTLLKKSILSPYVSSYIQEVILKLPECSESSTEKWKQLIFSSDSEFFPKCRPRGLEITPEIVMQIQQRIIEDIPMKVTILEGSEYFPRNINIPKFISTATYFLFIFPLIFILLGSLIAAKNTGSFLRWSGISVMIGGISAYAFGNLLNNIIPISNRLGPNFNFTNHFSSHYSNILSGKIVEFSDVILKQLFNPVSHLGGIIAIIGLIVFSLSFLSKQN